MGRGLVSCFLCILVVNMSVKIVLGDVTIELAEYSDPTAWRETEVPNSNELTDPTGWNYDDGTSSVRSDNIVTFCNNLLKSRSDIQEAPSTTVIHNFVHRIINVLLDSAGLPEKYKNKDDLSGLIEVKLTIQQYEILTKFTQSLENISFQTLDSVLTNSIIGRNEPSFKVGDYVENIFFNISQKEFWLPLLLVFMAIILMITVASSKSYIHIISRVLVLLFIISYVIEYHRMYKDKELEQRMVLDKHKQVPASCRKGWLTAFFYSLINGETFSDECKNYYKALSIDPFIEVSPMRVLSSIISDFLLHPASKIGLAIAEFSKAIIGNLPIQYGWFVWMVSGLGAFFIFCFIIILISGYTLQYGHWLGGKISISSQEKPKITSRSQPLSANHETSESHASPITSGASERLRSSPITSGASEQLLPLLITNGSSEQPRPLSTITLSRIVNTRYVLVEEDKWKGLMEAGPSNRIEELVKTSSEIINDPLDVDERTDIKSCEVEEQVETVVATETETNDNLSNVKYYKQLCEVFEKCESLKVLESNSSRVENVKTSSECEKDGVISSKGNTTNFQNNNAIQENIESQEVVENVDINEID